MVRTQAYKKCLLCSLIEIGEPPKLPKYTSPTITRPIKNQIAPYTEFADAFAARKPTELCAALEKHAAAFSADHNLGLAKQCVPALVRRSVRMLTETYLTLSLAHIAEHAGLPDEVATERSVREMVAASSISATIDAHQGIVHFLERPERHDSKAALVSMEGALQEAIALAGKLHDAHTALAVDPHYLARNATAQERAPQWEDEALMSK